MMRMCMKKQLPLVARSLPAWGEMQGQQNRTSRETWGMWTSMLPKGWIEKRPYSSLRGR